MAIIMDGNGRWAQKRHFYRALPGHRIGVKTSRTNTSKRASRLHLRALTLYGMLSVENWRRPQTSNT